MKKFQGKINEVEYTSEEEFKKALDSLDTSKGYSVSFSTEECEDKKEEIKQLNDKKEEVACLNLYPDFNIDELSQKVMTEDFVKMMALKLDSLVEYSKYFNEENLEAHLTNIHNLTKTWRERLNDTNTAYKKILDRVKTLQKEVNEYEERIEELSNKIDTNSFRIEDQKSKLDVLNHTLDYLEVISQFYEDYQDELEELRKPDVKGHVVKEQKVSEPRAEESIRTTCKQTKEQREVGLDDKTRNGLRNLLDILFG